MKANAFLSRCSGGSTGLCLLFLLVGLACGLPAQTQKSGESADADVPAAESSEVNQFIAALAGKLRQPKADEVSGAIVVGEAFIAHCAKNRPSEAMALLAPESLAEMPGEKLTAAIETASQQTGALVSATPLRGLALFAPPDKERAEPVLWLGFICEFEKGLHRVTLRLRPPGEGTGGAWRVLMYARTPLFEKGWYVWEMSSSLSFAVALRAEGRPPADWEPLVRAGERIAVALGVKSPPIPVLAGKPAADIVAAKEWLAKGFPGATREAVEKLDAAMYLDGAPILATLHLLYGQPESTPGALEKLVAQMPEGAWEEGRDAIGAGLRSGLKSEEFRGLCLMVLMDVGKWGGEMARGPLYFGLPEDVREMKGIDDEMLGALRATFPKSTAMTHPVTPADVDAASRTAEAFLTACGTGNVKKAMALIDNPLTGIKTEPPLREAMEESGRLTGALKSALLLRGRALRILPRIPMHDDFQAPTAWPLLTLPYVCEHTRGMSLVNLVLEQRGETGAWMITGYTRHRLDGALAVREITACAGLGISLRAHGAPQADSESLAKAAQRIAASLNVRIPDPPAVTQMPEADVDAARQWLSKTFPDALLPAIDRKLHDSAMFGLQLAEFHLRYQDEVPIGEDLLEKATAFGDSYPVEGSLIYVALYVDTEVKAEDFRRTVILAANFLVEPSEDPLSNAMGAAVLAAAAELHSQGVKKSLEELGK